MHMDIVKARELLAVALTELDGTPSPAIRDELASGYATPYSLALSALEAANIETAIAGLPPVPASV